MILIWGSNNYGKVDRVPGLFHVCTNFGHLYYVPLIPTGSYLRFEMPGYEDRAIPIAFSFKSWMICWLRTLLGFVGFFSAIAAFGIVGVGSPVMPTIFAILGIGSWLFMSFSGLVVNASHDGAQRILEKNGLQDLQGAVDEHFQSLNEYGGQQQGYGAQGGYSGPGYGQQRGQNNTMQTGAQQQFGGQQQYGAQQQYGGNDQWSQNQSLTPLDDNQSR